MRNEYQELTEIRALRLPTVRGLVIGRAVLYPAGDDVAAAVDTAVGLL